MLHHQNVRESCTVREQWPYGEESRRQSSPELMTTVARLCALRRLPGPSLGCFFGDSLHRIGSGPSVLAKKDVIIAIENIARSNVLIVRHEMIMCHK